jgi:predicted transcriptional regulator
MDELREEQRTIWRRRDAAKDVWQAELARLSGVSQPFVAREIAK